MNAFIGVCAQIFSNTLKQRPGSSTCLWFWYFFYSKCIFILRLPHDKNPQVRIRPPALVKGLMAAAAGAGAVSVPQARKLLGPSREVLTLI